MELRSLKHIHLPFSGGRFVAGEGEKEASGIPRKLIGQFLRLAASPQVRTRMRHWLVPKRIPQAAQSLQRLVADLDPDLVHAMRIPFEGMLAAKALEEQESPPLVASVWGNDFTLHAPATQGMGRATRFTLDRVAALHTDCQRDQRLAMVWGFNTSKPAIVLPGGGGIQSEVFFPADRPSQDLPPVVINPRGMRTYVRNQVFFRAIPLILESIPQARFICPSMAGDTQAQGWVESNGIETAVELLPRVTREAMAGLYRRSAVVVSPSVHDGTPNSLLEAMACGCFPVVGDIESLREWITPGINGLLVDPEDPKALAQAILLALNQPGLRDTAEEHNARLIAERASYGRVMAEAEAFYRLLLDQPQS
jgi:glycosyltransferase involved in cell wall biosynthesis